MKCVKYVSFVGVFLLLSLLSACINDSTLAEFDVLSEDEAYVELLLQSKAGSLTASSAVLDSDSDIQSLSVLVFEHDEQNKEGVLAYKAPVKSINAKQDGTFSVIARLQVSQSEQQKYSLSLFGNTAISNIELEEYLGAPKTEVVKEFAFKANQGSNRSSYLWGESNLLPMYGESGVHVISKLPQILGPIYMIRSVAKVSIDLSKAKHNGIANPEIELVESYVFNAVAKGQYASKYHHYFTDKEKKDSLIPHNDLVSWPFFSEDESPYLGWIPLKNSNEKSLMPIYLAENRGGIIGDVRTTTCFIIGLKLAGSGEVSYYRLDIPHPTTYDSAGNPVEYDQVHTEPILRNRHYTIAVSNIQGPGAASKEEALSERQAHEIVLRIQDWNEWSRNYSLEGEVQFAITERDILLPYEIDEYTNWKKGVSVRYISPKIYYQTNLEPEQIVLKVANELELKASSSEELVNGRYHYSFGSDERGTYLQIELKLEQENNAVVSVANHTGKPEEVNQIADLEPQEFELQVAGTIFPMNVSPKAVQVQEYINPLGADKRVKVIPYGMYVKNSIPTTKYYDTDEDLKNAEHYIELLLPYDGEVVKEGNYVLAGNTKEGAVGQLQNGLTFQMYRDYPNRDESAYMVKIEQEHIRIIQDEQGSVQKFASIKIPGFGMSGPETESSRPYQALFFIFTKKGIYKGYSDIFNIRVLPREPEYKKSKVLFVADGYTFNYEKAFEEGSSNVNKNLARVLYNPKIFGLEEESTIKVEPFISDIYAYNDEGEQVIQKNVSRVDHVVQLTQLGSAANIENYDVIFYLKSAKPNELLSEELAPYREVIAKRVKEKKLVFIQSPAKDSGDGEYVDPLMSLVAGEPVKVELSSLLINNQRHVEVDLDKIGAPFSSFNYDYYSSKNLQKTNLKSLNRLLYPLAVETVIASTHRADVSYLAYVSTDLPSVITDLSWLGFAKELTENPFRINRVVLAEIQKNYLWIGSSYLFLDRATQTRKIEGYYYPSFRKAKSITGAFQSVSKETYSLNFFIYLMHWSLHQINKK